MREESSWILTPVSLAWKGVVWLRHQFYRCGLLRVSSVDLPVINVGSIAVGGVGKTPLVMKLLEELSEYKGAVLTRGYKGADEALMISKRYPTTQVRVGKNRLKNTRQLSDREFFLLDDGWQYRKLKGDFAIAVLSDDVIGSAYVPKGRLRDLPCRLKEADMVVVTHAETQEAQKYWEERLKPLTKAPLVFAGYQMKKIAWLGKEVILNPGDPVACFCGIGNPDSFLQLIDNKEFNVKKTLILGDHEKPSHKKLEELAEGVKAILCTEKDFVKLDSSSLPIGMIEIEYRVVKGEKAFHSLLAKIKTEIHRRRK